MVNDKCFDFAPTGYSQSVLCAFLMTRKKNSCRLVNTPSPSSGSDAGYDAVVVPACWYTVCTFGSRCQNLFGCHPTFAPQHKDR